MNKLPKSSSSLTLAKMNELFNLFKDESEPGEIYTTMTDAQFEAAKKAGLKVTRVSDSSTKEVS